MGTIGAVVFLVFGSTEQQPWAVVERGANSEDDETALHREWEADN